MRPRFTCCSASLPHLRPGQGERASERASDLSCAGLRHLWIWRRFVTPATFGGKNQKTTKAPHHDEQVAETPIGPVRSCLLEQGEKVSYHFATSCGPARRLCCCLPFRPSSCRRRRRRRLCARPKAIEKAHTGAPVCALHFPGAGSIKFRHLASAMDRRRRRPLETQQWTPCSRPPELDWKAALLSLWPNGSKSAQ